jgi:hypothetical protein
MMMGTLFLVKPKTCLEVQTMENLCTSTPFRRWLTGESGISGYYFTSPTMMWLDKATFMMMLQWIEDDINSQLCSTFERFLYDVNRMLAKVGVQAFQIFFLLTALNNRILCGSQRGIKVFVNSSVASTP